VGALGQLLVLPALAAVVVALAVSIIGLLAIPLAVAAVVLAVVGLATLGFLAVALLAGRSLAIRGDAPRAGLARGDAVRALAFGVGTFAILWTVTALSAPSPSLALVLRAVATALTWVAVTAGFGAALLSRAGTRRPARPGVGVRRTTGVGPAAREGVPVWQTPTPIAGIVAARRPTPVPGRHE
jgi:hypothetical protein